MPMRDDHRLDHLADRQRLAGVAADVFGTNQLKQRLALLARCCSGKSKAKPCKSARADQPEPWSYPAADWVQPCRTTTSGALSGKVRGYINPRPQHPGIRSEFGRSVRRSRRLATPPCGIGNWCARRRRIVSEMFRMNGPLACSRRGGADSWQRMDMEIVAALHNKLRGYAQREPAGFFAEGRNNGLSAPLGDSNRTHTSQGNHHGQIIQSGGQVATIHDQKLDARQRRRAASDCRRRRAGADDRTRRTGVGRPELAEDRRTRADRDRGLPFPREDLPLRSRAHSRARRARPRLWRAWLSSRPTIRLPNTRAPTSSSGPAKKRRPSSGSPPSPAAKAPSTSPATCAASP